MESYNFGEIRTPIFEETELFARAIGAETDVVSKEMFSFDDRPIELEAPKNLGDYDRYISDLERMLASGQIPATAMDRRKIDALKAKKMELDALRNQRATTTSPSPSSDEPFFSLVADLLLIDDSISLGESLTLRPEGTASVVRAYIERGLQMRAGDQKLYYIEPMFRRERPQRGRYRQFYQIGAEVLGTSDAPAIDAELIQMLTVLLERCQIEKYTLLINSIGCANCRTRYVELLRAELRKPEIYERLGADSKRRVETNPLRVMDSKLPEEQEIIEKKLPKISEHLCADCKAHYENLKKELMLREVPFTESPRLVRGLDYYMRTTFEITSPILGAQNALCGGGRYDGLVEMLGGPKGIKGI